MHTQYATSADHIRIAYDRSGSGPAILLLHGGGSRRQDWHEAGYVDRLKEDYCVITLDLRGHGESDLPTDPAAYTTDNMGRDILAVADACGVERFSLWGWSYGGRVGRYLAACSERVAKFVMLATPFGAGISAAIRQEIEDFCAHWPPILQAQSEGTLDLDALSPEEREFLGQFNIPVMMAWGQAMLDWPTSVPADVRCPTLWLVGSEDQEAMDSVGEFEAGLPVTQVQLEVVQGLSHEGVFEQVDRVFPRLVAFMRTLSQTT